MYVLITSGTSSRRNQYVLPVIGTFVATIHVHPYSFLHH
jgi:hypothetical protein